jgi:hypothetical protein
MPRKNQAKHRRTTTRSDKEQDYAVQMEQCIADSPFSNLGRLQNFSLYTPRQDLTNFLIRYEIFKRVLAVHGSIIECGVLRGGGLMAWAEFSAIFEPTNHQRRVGSTLFLASQSCPNGITQANLTRRVAAAWRSTHTTTSSTVLNYST